MGSHTVPSQELERREAWLRGREGDHSALVNMDETRVKEDL